VFYPISFGFAPCALPSKRAILPLTAQGTYVREDGTYLVTGGTQGFTLELAKGLLNQFDI
jgi:hypothetical protein